MSAEPKPPFIPIAKPILGVAEVEGAQRAILSGWVTQGPEVQAFEEEFAEFVGSEFACAVSNCTTALHLALRVAGVRPGDEVITVSHSYIATANSIRYCGAIPVFVDIEPESFNIDPGRIEPVVSDRTRAILCVHQMGMPCDMKSLVEIAKRHDLVLIEDAACAIGSEILWQDEWQKIGKPHGDLACFSFHPRKVITTGDGGMITTTNREWLSEIRRLRQHSMSVPDTVRHGSPQVVFESYPELGFNYRMTDIQAAVGRAQLERLSDIVAERRDLAERYAELLSAADRVEAAFEPDWARSNWQSYCVRLPETADQLEVMQAMLDLGVATRRGIMCAHREPAYQKEPWTCGPLKDSCECTPGRCEQLRTSELMQDSSILLPLFSGMTAEEQQRVVEALRSSLEG